MFDPDKKYKVRATGKAARFLGTLIDGKTAWAIMISKNWETLATRNAEGKSDVGPRAFDIIPAPVETSKFVNVYENNSHRRIDRHDTIEMAHKAGGPHRVGLLEYKYADGVLIDLVLHKSIA